MLTYGALRPCGAARKTLGILPAVSPPSLADFLLFSSFASEPDSKYPEIKTLCELLSWLAHISHVLR